MIHLLNSEYEARYIARKKRKSGVIPMDFDGSSNGGFHEPVLAQKAAELLAVAPGKWIVDGTLGGGGHSEKFLQAGANVIALDQDPNAIAYAKSRLGAFGDQFYAVQENFSDLTLVLDRLGVDQIDGAFFDLGISSYQLDTAERGFSFMHDGPLDMRMNPDALISAADLVNNASGEQLERIFRNYGEEPAARRIAARIARERLIRPYVRTFDLVRTIESVSPRRGKTHPATRIFQALRIAVNRELDALSEVLAQSASRLRPGGRLGVLTFHSLEDRIVKTFFKTRAMEWIDRPEWPAARPNPEHIFKLITHKPLIPSAEEQAANSRSRSAKLRVVERI